MNRTDYTKKISDLIITNPNLTAGFISIITEELSLFELERIFLKLKIIANCIDDLVSSKN